jgi:hypothetical protein
MSLQLMMIMRRRRRRGELRNLYSYRNVIGGIVKENEMGGACGTRKRA